MAITIKHSELTQIIKEGVQKEIQTKKLLEQKKFVETCINKLERGQLLSESEQKQLDELSWQGVKNVFKTGGAMAGKAVAGAAQKTGQAVAGAAQKAGQAVAGAGQAVAGAVKTSTDKAINAVHTKYTTIEQGVNQIAAELGQAATKGDISSIKQNLGNMFTKTIGLIKKLNEKEAKLGVPITKYQSMIMKAVYDFKKAEGTSEPATA